MNLEKYTNTTINKCFIKQYMFGYCTDLAKCLNIKTGLPINAVINHDDNDHDHYDHYFIRMNDIYFLDVCGIHTIDDIKCRWSNVFKVSITNVCIEETNLDDENIGDYENTNNISDHLIYKFGLSYTKKYESIKNIMNNLPSISINILGSELYKLINKNNGYYDERHKDKYDNNDNYQTFLESIITKIDLIEFKFMTISNYMIKIYFNNSIINYVISSANIELFVSDLLDYIT